jgi:preprotein translocase SecE subunit
MAVAVKNREATSAQAFDRLAVNIVAGVLYVLVSLALLFPVADFVWWDIVGPALQFSRGDAGWWFPLIGIDTLLAIGLIAAGKRLLDARPIKGLRAGIVLGVVSIFLIVLLTDWVGGQLADLLFAKGMNRTLGIGLTAGFGIAVLLVGGRYFLSEKGERLLADIEDQGWFGTDSYKKSQGLRVRRGTMLGILLLAGSGIWVLHQGLLKQGWEASWSIGIPFTAEVPIDWQTVGDDTDMKQALEVRQQPLTARWEERRQEALKTLRQASPLPADIKEQLHDLAKDDADVQKLLAEVPRRGAGDQEEPGLNPEQEKSLAAGVKVLREQQPGAVVPVDRFWLRDHNEVFEKTHVKITDPGSDPYQTLEPRNEEKFEPKTGDNFQQGEVVSKAEFEHQQRLRQDKHDQLVEHKDRRVNADLVVPPKEERVIAAKTEPVQYRERVLLPHVAYTLPVILAALALWFSWRVVNVPAFADFLIATEAELNKVSWTSRKRLWQDTVVVLCTVILMALFLLAADVAWSKILTVVGVLQPPPAPSEKMQEQPW